MRIDRRGAGLITGIVAAVALVALASRDDHGGGDAILSMSSEASSASQTAFFVVVALLAVGVLVLMLVSLSVHKPDLDARRRPHAWARIVASVLAVVLFAAVMAHARPRREAPVVEAPPGRTVDDGSAVRTDDGEAGSPAWSIGLAGLLVIVATGIGVVLATRPRRGQGAGGLELPIATPQERDDAVARAHACLDPREAVLLAFAAAEAVLSADPATRRPPATSAREWAALVRIAPLTVIVSRYEIARFSDHAVTERDRTAALDALEALAVPV